MAKELSKAESLSEKFSGQFSEWNNSENGVNDPKSDESEDDEWNNSDKGSI